MMKSWYQWCFLFVQCYILVMKIFYYGYFGVGGDLVVVINLQGMWSFFLWFMLYGLFMVVDGDDVGGFEIFLVYQCQYGIGKQLFQMGVQMIQL